MPPGVSTVGAAPTSEGAAAKTTSVSATPTGTGSGAGSTSTSTPKSNVGATVGHNFALAIGGMVFAGTLLVAVLL